MQHKTLYILLFTLLPFYSFAQKAYETEHYAGKLNGKSIKLELANGYIGACQIILRYTGKSKPTVFIPDMGVADEHNQLTFHAIAQNRQDYFILSNMQELYEQAPVYIKGEYHVNKKVAAIKFQLIK